MKRGDYGSLPQFQGSEQKGTCAGENSDRVVVGDNQVSVKVSIGG